MSRPRALIVDDDTFFRSMMGAELKAAGFQVAEAEDVATARQAIETGGADVMLLDYLLPDGTAVDVWTHAKDVRPQLARRTILITGNLEKAERERLEHASGAPVLTKPFQPEVLVHLLLRLLKDSE